MGEQGGYILATAAFAGAALYLSWHLSKGLGDFKTPNVAEDEGPSTQVNQGSYIHYVVGRARVGVLYAWVGNRETKKVSQGSVRSSSKGSGGSSKKTKIGKKTVYFEDCFAAICVGPAEEIVDVYFAGKSVLIGDESPAPTFPESTYPSGSSLPVGNSGDQLEEATVYWGELDQPADSKLTDSTIGMNVASRWPLICYLQLRANLGELPRWPLIDVEIMTTIQDTGSVNLVGSTPKLSSVTYTDGRDGLNGAHILAQMLFGAPPYGLQLDDSLFDISSLETLGALLETEGVLSSVVGVGGESFKALIGQLMQDIGCVISWDPDLGQYVFVPIREPSSPPVIPLGMVQSRPIESQVRHTEFQADKTVFRFFDVDRRYRPSTIHIGSDSATLGSVAPRTKTVQIPTCFDSTSAVKIAERRSQEGLGQESVYRMRLNRNAGSIYPGRPFQVSGFAQTFLVRTVELDVLSGNVDIEAMENTIGLEASTFFLNGHELPPLVLAAQSDVQKELVEVPLFLLTNSDPPSIFVPRIRAHKQISRAEIHLSDDDVTYDLIGSSTSVETGGVLAPGNPLPAGDAILETGPEVTFLGPPDDDEIQDLSSRTDKWRAGDQVVVINSEIMFVRELVAVGGGRWRMDGIIRARMGTVQEDHSVNDEVYVFDPQEVFDGTHSMLVSGNTVYLKTQPGTLAGLTDLASEVSLLKVLYMTGHRPLPPVNLRVQGNVNSFETGQDVTFEWSYRSRGGGPAAWGNNGSGAGMANSGQSVTDAPAEGQHFLVRIYDDPLGANTLVRVQTVPYVTPGLQSWTYDNADIISDLGAEETFGVTITERNAGLESDPPLEILVEFV